MILGFIEAELSRYGRTHIAPSRTTRRRLTITKRDVLT